MKKIVNKFVLIGALIVLAGGMAACGKKTNTTSSSSTSSQSDVFTYAISGDPSSLNPINVSDRWGLTVTNMVFSPLVRIEGDGTQKFELAESLEASEDGKSLLARLRQDIKWSDGEPFTADDVVFTYTEKAKRENGGADGLWVDDQPIKVVKVNDYEVRFELPTVSAAALNNIATEVYIIPQHVYQDIPDFSVTDLGQDLVGTGPYKLVKNKRGEYLQFEANEHYFREPANIKNVTLRILTSSDTTKVALQKGEVDASFVLPNDVKEIEKSGLKPYVYSENRVGYLGLNTHSQKLAQKEVRQAIFYALNREEMNLASYLSKDYFDNAVSILPPQNPFVTDKVNDYSQDEAKSKALLKQANINNLRINLGFSSDDPAQSLQAALIQQQLQKVGIQVELKGGDGSAIFTELKKPGSEAYDMFLGGYIMGNDPDLYSTLYASYGSANYFQYHSDETDQLFHEGAVALDQEKRQSAYEALQVKIMDDAIVYPIVDSKKVLMVNPRIEHVEEAGLVPIYTFEDMSKLSFK